MKYPTKLKKNYIMILARLDDFDRITEEIRDCISLIKQTKEGPYKNRVAQLLYVTQNSITQNFA